MILKFSSFLFDSEDAWKRAIKDPDYDFIKSDISKSFIFNQNDAPIHNEEPKKTKEENTILNQSEIDALLNKFILTK